MSAAPLIDNRQAWLEERRSYIGGTDVAAIVGKSKYKTELDIYLEKTGQKTDTKAGRKAEAGIALEPYIREWYSEDIGQPILGGETIRDKEFPFLGANIDGKLDASTLVEIKTMDFSTREEWGEPGTDEVPIHYFVQCIWYLGMTGADRVILVKCDRGTMNIEDYIIEPSPDLYQLCRREAINLWQNHILTGVPPEPTERDGSNLIYLFPQRTAEILIADDKVDAMASEMADLHNQIKPLEKRKKELSEAMKVMVGDANGIDTIVGKFTVSRMKGKVSWKDVATHYNPTPEVIEAHTGNPYDQLSTPF